MKTDSGRNDVVIIGSGLSGLLCGFILAREGMKVCILEKNKRAGGCLQSFRRFGKTFDTGVHYFGSLDPGQTLERYWNYFGLTGALPFERMDPEGFDRIVIGNEEYPFAMGSGNFIDTLGNYFPETREVLNSYVDSLNDVASSFPMYNLGTWSDHRKIHHHSTSADQAFQELVNPAQEFSTTSSGNSRLLSVLAGNNFLYSGDPLTTPFSIPALINHSFIASAWRPVGGSQQIADFLIERIRGYGGTVYTGQEVSRVSLAENIFHVNTSESETFSSRYLISGIAPSTTLRLLDPALLRQSTIKRIQGLKNTPSSFAVYLSLKENCVKHNNCNYYIHRDDDVWSAAKPHEWPHSCLVYTTREDVSSGFANAMVILSSMNFSEVKKWETTNSGARDKEYLQFKMEKASALLDLAELKFPGIRSSVQAVETSTPLTWRDYTRTPEGSMYGIQREFERPLETTILPRTKIPNLFFTGQNTNMHGVLGVTIGAVMTCGEIVGLEMLMKKIRNG
jgi:all-trans-retinol 13,14-reductase